MELQELKRIGLEGYYDALRQDGFETLTDYKLATFADLTALEFKRGHGRRFLEHFGDTDSSTAREKEKAASSTSSKKVKVNPRVSETPTFGTARDIILKYKSFLKYQSSVETVAFRSTAFNKYKKTIKSVLEGEHWQPYLEKQELSDTICTTLELTKTYNRLVDAAQASACLFCGSSSHKSQDCPICPEENQTNTENDEASSLEVEEAAGNDDDQDNDEDNFCAYCGSSEHASNVCPIPRAPSLSNKNRNNNQLDTLLGLTN